MGLLASFSTAMTTLQKLSYWKPFRDWAVDAVNLTNRQCQWLCKLSFLQPHIRLLETDGRPSTDLWVSNISHLTPGHLIPWFIRKKKINCWHRTPPPPGYYLSGGSDLVHGLLFPEVSLARYIPWPQVLMKENRKKKKKMIGDHSWFLARPM